ncbi:MAG: DUF1700 domain-containing protein [Massilia sp.]
MRKLEFLDALKRAMPGLPPETQAKTLAYYEQRFVDGVAAGRSEEDVAQELDDPRKIAMTLRASAHLGAFQQKKDPANLLRLLVTGAGLAIFNLFMVVPAAVFSALLAALYACALAFYVGGIAITASGLAGANDLLLNVPHVVVDDGDDAGQTRVSIGDNGIEVHQEKPAPRPDEVDEPSRVLRGAEAVAGRKIHISTDLDAGSRTTQTLFGLGMVLGGIALFLAAIVVTRYSFIGIKRYIQMNFSLLRGG